MTFAIGAGRMLGLADGAQMTSVSVSFHLWDVAVLITPPIGQRREERPLAGPVAVQIGNRSMTMDCIGPPLSEILIGQVVLERLDLIADCTNRTLTPRYEDYPLLKLKAVGMQR